MQRKRYEQAAQPMDSMTVDGHKATIRFDSALGLFRGEFTGLAGGADFYAEDVAGLQREGAASLCVYLAACAERGLEPLVKPA